MRSRAVRWVAVATLGVAALVGWVLVRPVLRHDAEARELAGRVAEAVTAATGARPERTSSRVGDSPPGANGGHCWYYATVTVRTPLSASEVEARLNDALSREPLSWWVDGVRATEPGVLVVSADALGEGGTLDLRCG